MLNKNKAFTLTELLLALGIVGTIAALSIPTLMKNINNRIMATKLKSNIQDLQVVTAEQVTKLTNAGIPVRRTLADTDFATPANLLTSSNFSIDYQKCSSTSTVCWSEYRNLNGAEYKISENLKATGGAVKLRNGAYIYYETTPNSDTFGHFIIDLNGFEAPNIVGRDLFEFYMTKTGELQHYSIPNPEEGEEIDEEQAELEAMDRADYNSQLDHCKDGNPASCFYIVQRDNWELKY